MLIQYIKNENIDRIKWDNRVATSNNGFIYAQSFYLDGMCHWDALVYRDYECIMPLPYRNKWGISYIYTPNFVAQLGVIGNEKIMANLLELFIKNIPKKFKYIDIKLNEFNTSTKYLTQHSIVRTNYILELNKNYDLIFENFLKDAKKNIRTAEKEKLIIRENINIDIVFELYKNAYSSVVKSISNTAYEKFKTLCSKAIQQNKGFTISVENTNGEIHAAAFFGIDNKRIYYLLGAPTKEGRKYSAIHFLINEVIKKYAEHNLIFDFEGSDIESVATFYKKFSPKKINYSQIIINNLPLLFRWLKK